ncbi:hypothetical protein [Emticicia soli]|uniref:Uncharacterized protein n=1 Tax=Emticicia soli TaxID=2027878 RepID=A0ABW5JD72_9BACT
MIEVFITDIQTQMQADSMLEILKKSFPELKFNFDLSSSDAPFPCGNNILRAEGAMINAESIIATLNKSAFKCEVLEDKICV